MSRVHSVVSGDTLGAISIRYLGTFAQWRDIATANPQLYGRRTAVDGSPLIFVGDQLIIPEEDKSEIIPASPQTITLSDSEEAQDVSIVIDGKRFTGWTGYELGLSYDGFDTFSFTSPYCEALEKLKECIMPFTFKNCLVYYDNDLIFKGTLLTPDPKLTDSDNTINLQGYPLCGILNDCTVPPALYPGNYESMNLKEIADKMGNAYGIKIIFDCDPGGTFQEVNFEPTEKILSFLLKLCQQRKILYTNDNNGRLVFFKPKKESAFVTFKEGEVPLQTLTPKFKAQEFYSHITGFTKTSDDNPSRSFTWENKFLTKRGITRHQTITIDDAETAEDLENAVKAHAGRMFADCISLDLDCDTHKNQDGKLFYKGMYAAIYSPAAMIHKETLLLARKVTLKRDVAAKTSNINLVLPGSFTDEIPEVLPWE